MVIMSRDLVDSGWFVFLRFYFSDRETAREGTKAGIGVGEGEAG